MIQEEMMIYNYYLMITRHNIIPLHFPIELYPLENLLNYHI